jgi:hypothetical protein
LSFVYLGCSQQSFDSSEPKRSSVSGDDSNPYTAITPSTGDPASADPSANPPVAIPPTVIADPTTNGELNSDGTAELIPAEPAISPTIIAGASLTCQRGVPRTDVTCVVRSEGVATDAVPKHIYVVKGKAATWVATPFKRIQIGTYLMSVEVSLPESFAVGLTYGANQYLVAMVGTAYPEYNNLVRDGGFDAVPVDNGAGSTSRIRPNQLVAANSPWRIQVRGGQPNCVFGENDALFELRNLNRGGAAFAQTKSLYLDTACPSGGGVNMFLMQDLAVQITHVYRIYASYKASALPAAGAASQNLQLGIGQDGASSVFINYGFRDTDWHLAQVPIVPSIATPYLFATESGTADRVGFMIDDIKFYDLGIPKLD